MQQDKEQNQSYGMKNFSINVHHLPRKQPLLVPEVVWKTFPRQNLALEFAKTCYQDVAVFAYEGKDSTNPGGRRFLATTYHEFGGRYIPMKPPRHFYEVITEGSACHLYFDLEYSITLNPRVDPLKLLDIFIQYVCCQLKFLFNLSCDSSNVLNLDSTSEEKFSRHLIFHLNNTAFQNNLVVGDFVRHICDRLRLLKDTTDGGDYRDMLHPNRGKHVCSCPSAEELLSLFVVTRQGTGLICDEAVYTRNRNFRLLLSSKKGKKVTLKVSKQNKFKSCHAVDETKRKWSELFNNLMDSLICNVRYETTSNILDSPFDCIPKRQSIKHLSKSLHPPVCEEGGVSSSPFPTIDEYITSQLVRDGMVGKIRHWTYFSQGKLIVYEIKDYRWCENIGRHHKSNNIMIIADLKCKLFYQKCHDPDCKRINFRSKSYPIPPGLIAFMEAVQKEDVSADDIKRVMLSEFSENDSFNEDCLPNQLDKGNCSNEEMGSNLEYKERQAVVLQDLSIEDIFGDNSTYDHDDLEMSKKLLHDLRYEEVFELDAPEPPEVQESLDAEQEYRDRSPHDGHKDKKEVQMCVLNGIKEYALSHDSHVTDLVSPHKSNEIVNNGNISSGNREDYKLSQDLLQNLSYEDVFDPDFSPTQCTNHEVLLDLSNEDIFGDDKEYMHDSACEDSDLSVTHDGHVTSTPIKCMPHGTEEDRSPICHMTKFENEFVSHDTDEDDKEQRPMNLSEQEMISFLESTGEDIF